MSHHSSTLVIDDDAIVRKVIARELQNLGMARVVMAGGGEEALALLSAGVLLASSLATPATQWLERAPTTVQQLLQQLDRLRASIPMLPLAPAPFVDPAASVSTPVNVRSASTRRAALAAAAAASANEAAAAKASGITGLCNHRASASSVWHHRDVCEFSVPM